MHFFSLITFLSFLLTWGVRRYALVKNVMDIPNKRSSHTVPTPRGGGLAFTISILVGFIWLYNIHMQQGFFLITFSIASCLVAFIGFRDDLGHVSAKWRLLVHSLSAILVVYASGGLPPIYILTVSFDFGLIGDLLTILFLVWLLNLYNFMDGIDGIASIETITATGVSGGLLLWLGYSNLIVDMHWLTIASVLGFLFWNLPPAKIFMGDAGSGFLGILIGGLVLSSSHLAPQMFWVWLIMLGVFIVDATFTLFSRFLRGEKVGQAHRTHAYQYASQRFGGHQPVIIGVLIINLLWLAPLAYLAGTNVVDGVLCLLIAYAPLIALVVHFDSGNPSPDS